MTEGTKQNEEKMFKEKARKGKGGRSGAVPVPACVFIMTMGLVFGLAACGDAAAGKAEAPQANPPPGYVEVGTVVMLTSPTPGVVIYCTTSEGVPPALDRWGNPVINEDTTLIAFARAEGYEDSDEATFEYVVGFITVSFDLNGAGGTTPERLTAFAGGSITLPAAPVRTGHYFSGWWTKREGGDKAGDAGEPYTPAASLTLYARWTQDLSSILTGFPANTEDSPHTISIAAETDVCGDDWAGINDAVRSAGKYVILDLSNCGASSYTAVYGNGPFIKG